MNVGPDPAWDEPSALVVPVSRQVRCDIGFVVARVRLLKFLHLGFLHSACVSAYECALAVPRGSAASAQAPPLVVSIGEPESGNGAIALPLRWDADWGSGRPGQVLDAELAFSAVAGSTAVRFDGMFRLPGAHYGGRAKDELAQTRAAVSGAESLLTQVAEALIRDSEAEATRRPAWRWIRPDSPDGPDPRLAPHRRLCEMNRGLEHRNLTTGRCGTRPSSHQSSIGGIGGPGGGRWIGCRVNCAKSPGAK